MGNSSAHERVRQRAELALAASSREQIESFYTETAKEVLMGLARNPHLQERDLLRLLDRKDLAHEVVRELAQHKEVHRNYTVQLALVKHPKTPRLISLPLMKFLYVFDLLRVAQTPAVPADVKMVAEETILKKLEGMPRGEKISLARRGTGRLAASLLFSPDLELIRAALDNPYLTEGHLLKVLAREGLPPAVVEHLAQHERWSHHYHLRLALIRNPLTPFSRVLAFLPDMAIADLRDICLDHRMPQTVRKYIEAHCADRLNKQRHLPPQG
jgi:hypothetical protein